VTPPCRTTPKHPGARSARNGVGSDDDFLTRSASITVQTGESRDIFFSEAAAITANSRTRGRVMPDSCSLCRSRVDPRSRGNDAKSVSDNFSKTRPACHRNEHSTCEFNSGRVPLYSNNTIICFVSCSISVPSAFLSCLLSTCLAFLHCSCRPGDCDEGSSMFIYSFFTQQI
jgi:hypothetical protein